ncbi:MAG: hypothetical protein IJS45_05955 [Clostridia bacterium]|nr:hypothetical protein [Clostridia bacterium]
MEENENVPVEVTGENADEVLKTGDEAADAGSGDEDAALDEEFGKLIKGKYKNAYAKRTQSMINRRFREVKELENLRRTAAEVYGVADVTEDVVSAVKAGRTPESRDDTARTAIGVADEYGRLMAEADEVKKLYPSFDVAKEAENPLFSKLVASGVGIKAAYEALHHDSIVAGAMMLAAKRVADAARRGAVLPASRPGEGASLPTTAADPRPDVRTMSADDVRRILKRAENGEVIRF